MTLCGADLTHIMKTMGTLTDGTVLRVALRTLLALKQLHEIGFVHRDIKPCNFAVSHAAPRIIHVIDFGMTRKYAVKNDKSEWCIKRKRIAGSAFLKVELAPPFPIKCLIRVQPSHLQVMMQLIKRPLFWSPTGHIKVKTNRLDGVTFCAKDVVVPSQKSFAHLLKCRGVTEPLSYGVVAYSIQTRNSGRLPQRAKFGPCCTQASARKSEQFPVTPPGGTDIATNT
ncbi:unnamed protein product [Heligmosomoides polygyrus]|uniref:Protein kinase domain-containing protein n=1 Tax=Heligmosomoides polygyrus TaxID=6339 RepID=A0A183GH68_HELPZ|nr:unnamed protein product [Heligmosomoides polygyrus]